MLEDFFRKKSRIEKLQQTAEISKFLIQPLQNKHYEWIKYNTELAIRGRSRNRTCVFGAGLQDTLGGIW